MNNILIYGRDNLENVVSIEANDDFVEIFTEKDGTVSSIIKPNKYWMLCPKPFEGTTKLKGKQYYNYIKEFETKEDFIEARKRTYKADCWSVYDPKEAFMLRSGVTSFKSMKVEDVSVLSFDIETTGLVHDNTSQVLLISNTYQSQGKTIKKLFAYDDYRSGAEFIDTWCNWIRELNPSILIGHNIFGFDLKYLDYFAQMNGTTLKLGRDGSDIKFNDYESNFRKDGSQSYPYNNAYVYGREFCDIFFLAMKADISRKYDSYGLKAIIDHEGLQKIGRQFYDASTIKDNYKNPKEWEKIKAYAMDDADDALALYKLMIPAYFYMAQTIPMSFQSIINRASGSQINSIMIRSYLQDGWSIPKASDVNHFEGAISWGRPGVYRNGIKWDVSSLYPSIMKSFEVYDKIKDPGKHFAQITSYFLEERLKNKTLAKETKERYYDDLQASQKILANSLYGFLSAPGLHYNSPFKASFVTQMGRELLKKAIKWATGKQFEELNGL